MNKNDLYEGRKQIVRLYFNKGLTEEELSEIMKLSLKTIKEMRKK